jgi:hypothetical protein
VLRGHLGCHVHLSGGASKNIWSKYMNLGEIFEDVMDVFGLFFLFSSRYDSNLLSSYLEDKYDHENNPNPKLIHLILN